MNGGQTVFVTSAPFDAATVLYGGDITSGIVDTVAGRAIGYVAEDRLAAGDDSMAGYFFRSPHDGQRVARAARAKFASFPGVARIFDSGDIQIYDVRVLRGSP